MWNFFVVIFFCLVFLFCFNSFFYFSKIEISQNVEIWKWLFSTRSLSWSFKKKKERKFHENHTQFYTEVALTQLCSVDGTIKLNNFFQFIPEKIDWFEEFKIRFFLKKALTIGTFKIDFLFFFFLLPINMITMIDEIFFYWNWLK